MTPGKRLFDIIFALALIGLLALPFLMLLVIVLLKEGRPIFFVSERMKTVDQPFQLWKLRTMRSSTQNSGVSGGDKASRVTETGKILRKYRLDELPQLWNILRGDMSFVGPRPPLRQYVERFPALYRKVLASRPGVTGMATLVFHRHEEMLLAGCRTAEETDTVYVTRCIPRKARLDLIHAEHATFCSDIALILRTVKKVFRR